MSITLLAAFGLFACELASQGVQVGATGVLTVMWSYGVGSMIYNQPVSGATSIVYPAASASVATAALSALTLTANAPPPYPVGSWTAAIGNVTFTYASTVPVAGILRLTLAPQCPVFVPSIDVNDDGSIELSGQGTVDIPVVLGSDPLPIRVQAQEINNTVGSPCTGAFRIQFLPQPANLGIVNTPCGPTVGAALTGTAPTRRLTLRFGGMAGQIGALFVGGAATPQAGCGPATQPAASVILVPNPTGVEFVVPVSPALVGAYTLQYVELLANNQIAWSNGLSALLP